MLILAEGTYDQIALVRSDSSTAMSLASDGLPRTEILSDACHGDWYLERN